MHRIPVAGVAILSGEDLARTGGDTYANRKEMSRRLRWHRPPLIPWLDGLCRRCVGIPPHSHESSMLCGRVK